MIKRKMIFNLVEILGKTGIAVTKDNKYRRKIYRIIAGIAILVLGEISLGMYSYCNRYNFTTFISPICYIATVFVILCGIIILLHYKRIISEMLHQMDDNIHQYPDEHLLDIQYKWYLEERNIISFMSVLIYCEYACVLVIYLPSIIELLVDGDVRYIYPSWTPWKTDDFNSQLLKLIGQMLQGIFGMWLNHLTVLTIFISVLEFLRQYERLREAVISLKRRTIAAMMLKNNKIQCSFEDLRNDDVFNNILRNNIIQCIRHHQKLHRNFNLFRIWFSAFFSCELAVSLLSFAMGLYVILNTSGTGEMINYFAVSSIIYTNIFSLCFIGELLSDLNDRVRYKLFTEVLWCEINPKNQQLVVMFHLMLSRPFRIYGLSIFPSCRATFALLLRTTYSAFNIINMTLKEE